MKLYFAQKENDGYFSQYAQNLKTGFILFMQIVDYPLTKLSVDFGSDTRNTSVNRPNGQNQRWCNADHCTEDSTSSRRPDDDAVPAQREEIPQQDQCTQSSGSWQHSWACTERLCSGTHWCLHRHFQHLTKPGCCPHMLQSYHHHSSPKEVISILLQWLPSSSTHSYSHEVLWTVSHAAHQVCPPPLPGPLPVCI